MNGGNRVRKIGKKSPKRVKAILYPKTSCLVPAGYTGEEVKTGHRHDQKSPKIWVDLVSSVKIFFFAHGY